MKPSTLFGLISLVFILYGFYWIFVAAVVGSVISYSVELWFSDDDDDVYEVEIVLVGEDEEC